MKNNYILLVIGLSLVSSSLLVRGAEKTADKPSAPATLSNDFLIVPGQSIGKVYLGEDQKNVHQTLGHWSGMVLNGLPGNEGESYKSGIGVSYVDYKVVEIRAWSKQYQTQNKVSVGSSFELIQKLFKDGVLSSEKTYSGNSLGKITKTTTYNVYTEAKIGVKFQFGIFAEHPTKWCDMITIIKPRS
ncbi:MAG: hypothetical protein ABI210_07240 [Abditibacteriaceae bacterium]